VFAMLKQRVITAVALLLVSLPALLHPSPVALGVLGMVLVSAASWEWGRLNGLSFAAAFAMPAVCILLFLTYWSRHQYLLVSQLYWLICMAIWFFTILIFLNKGSSVWQSHPSIVSTLLGCFFAVFNRFGFATSQVGRHAVFDLCAVHGLDC